MRAIVLADFRSWHGWDSRGDFDDLKREVHEATSCAAILHALTRHEGPGPQAS